MPYVILALSGLLPAIWVARQRLSASLIATWFVAAAIVHTADWLASGALGLYKYHPGLFSDLNLDDATGVVLAEFVFVSSLAVLLVTLVPHWWGSLLGSAIVTTIEIFFHSAGLLKYHGWHLWYTTGGFIIYFLLVRAFWQAAQRNGVRDGWVRIVRDLAIVVTINGLFEITQWMAMAVKISGSILPDQEKNQALLRFLWHMAVRIPMAYWVVAGQSFTWRLRVLVASVASLTLNTLAVEVGLRQYKPPWNPANVILEQALFFILAAAVSRWIDALRDKNRHPLT